MKFYLGTHKVSQKWWDLEIPLFVSRRSLLEQRKRELPRASADWALDSGGFTELSIYGEWRTTPERYREDVVRFAGEIGKLEWVSPQDWMCEPEILAKTGLTVIDHQARTIESFMRLRWVLGDAVIPVLQGWTRDQYLDHWDFYDKMNFDLESEPLVGLGTICRRQATAEAGKIVRALAPLKLHGFGVKVTGLYSFSDALASADSMAWSYRGRHDRIEGHPHKHCGNCIEYAQKWREQVLRGLAQQRMVFT